jgi:DNA-binding response OmpR family regulator
VLEPLNEQEKTLVAYLAANADRAVPKDELLTVIGSRSTSIRLIDVILSRVRSKRPDLKIWTVYDTGLQMILPVNLTSKIEEPET